MKRKQTLAQRTKSVSVLEELSRDKDEEIRACVAINKNTPPHILEVLSQDEDEEIKMWVAYHKNTPVPVLEKLSMDKEGEIRRGVAANDNTPVSILEFLCEDKNEAVSRRAIWNLVDREEIFEVAKETKRPGLLEIFGREPEQGAKEGVAMNINAPVSLLETLSRDECNWVRGAATAALQLRKNPLTGARTRGILGAWLGL